MFAIAAVIGVAVGVAAFTPLIFGMKKARMVTATSNLGHAGSLLLGVLLSFVVLGAAVAICVVAVRDMAVPFTVGAAAGLIIAAVAFGVSKQLRK